MQVGSKGKSKRNYSSVQVNILSHQKNFWRPPAGMTAQFNHRNKSSQIRKWFLPAWV